VLGVFGGWGCCLDCTGPFRELVGSNGATRRPYAVRCAVCGQFPLHSYLIVSYAKKDGVLLDVGFYYMSNATGRLIGTVLSGWVYQAHGLEACLWVSSAFVCIAALISTFLPKSEQSDTTENRG